MAFNRFQRATPHLEAELKPVAAGDAVARPVVEVLVGDDALHVAVQDETASKV